MSRTAFVTPAAGWVVIKPDLKTLAAEGETVPLTSFWIRRIADGDVVEQKETSKSKSPATAQEKSK